MAAPKTKVLVLCGDLWHPAHNIHEALQPLESFGFEFDFINSTAEWPAERASSYPIIVLAKANHVSSEDRSPWMTPAVESIFQDTVSAGAGLLVLHSGSAEYTECKVLRKLLGGLFISHPAQCTVSVEPKSDHAVTTGSAQFARMDEHYMMDMNDPAVEVFLNTTSEHGVQPGGWTRREGKGRVCVLTPGHNIPVLLDPSYQAIIRNALEWCGAVNEP